MSRVVVRRDALRVRLGGEPVRRSEDLAAEEPLEIRVDGSPLSVTMRTPGADFDLVAGLLVSEGIVRAAEHLVSLRYCAGVDEKGRQTYNVIDAVLGAGAGPLPDSSIRSLWTTSACGLCGKAGIDGVRTRSSYDVSDDDLIVDAGTLAGLPDIMRSAQRVFARTGGLHAAALFDRAGGLLAVREDVGRHNAVDKVVGNALREGRLPLRATCLQVSGRASFELVQKAVMAGIPLLAAVSAPSSLAVDLAQEAGLTLVGFSRGESLNVYTGQQRVRL